MVAGEVMAVGDAVGLAGDIVRLLDDGVCELEVLDYFLVRGLRLLLVRLGGLVVELLDLDP